MFNVYTCQTYVLGEVKNSFIASYYRQLSVDIKVKNYSFVSPEGPKSRTKMVLILWFLF